MAATVKELKARITELEDLSLWQNIALSRDPDIVRKSGKIKGEDIRYTLRVWIQPRSGSTACAITTHYPSKETERATVDFRLDIDKVIRLYQDLAALSVQDSLSRVVLSMLCKARADYVKKVRNS